MTSHYHTKSGIDLKEEVIKAGKDKVVEEYLLASPHVYA
jgi:hypothetical protein